MADDIDDDDSNELPQDGDNRRKVKYRETRLQDMLDTAEECFVEQEIGLYQMAGRLVEVIRLDKGIEMRDRKGQLVLRRPAGALVLNEVTSHRLRELLITAVRWYRLDKRNNQWMPGAVPLDFAKHLLDRGTWKLPVLEGIVETPVLRKNGTVLDQKGYDPEMRVYMDPNITTFPEVPENPTRDDALKAIAKLKDVIKDFPFIPDDPELDEYSSAGRSVVLSAYLLSLSRKAMTKAPAHAIDATTMATGKSLLCDTISILATGRNAITMSQGADDVEFDKRMFSLLLKGGPVVVVDNIGREVSSDEFCTILTSNVWQSRVLGVSKTATVNCASTFLLNGNGLIFKGDVSTRAVLCKLDADMERPQERKFDRNLEVWMPEHQGELVQAALTAIRAFVVAGYPGAKDLTPSRFDDWDRFVRGTLVWLGEPDPWDTVASIRSADPERDNLAMLLAGWDKAFGSTKVTAKEVVDYQLGDVDIDPLHSEAAAEELDAALRAIMPGKAGPSVRGLSRYLTKVNGRIVNGVKVVAIPIPGHAALYMLAKGR